MNESRLREIIREEISKLNETKFIAFYARQKIEIEATSLWDAKQKAIVQLKVPKSKVGLLAVTSAKSQENQEFRFENILNEYTRQSGNVYYFDTSKRANVFLQTMGKLGHAPKYTQNSHGPAKERHVVVINPTKDAKKRQANIDQWEKIYGD